MLLRGQDPQRNYEALLEAALPFESRGLRVNWIFDAVRQFGPEAAMDVVEWAQKCRSARIVLGGVAPIPWRVADAERLLVGQKVTADLAAKVSEAAVAKATPLAKNGYKVPLTKSIVARTVLGLATRA